MLHTCFVASHRLSQPTLSPLQTHLHSQEDMLTHHSSTTKVVHDMQYTNRQKLYFHSTALRSRSYHATAHLLHLNSALPDVLLCHIGSTHTRAHHILIPHFYVAYDISKDCCKYGLWSDDSHKQSWTHLYEILVGCANAYSIQHAKSCTVCRHSIQCHPMQR